MASVVLFFTRANNVDMLSRLFPGGMASQSEESGCDDFVSCPATGPLALVRPRPSSPLGSSPAALLVNVIRVCEVSPFITHKTVLDAARALCSALSCPALPCSALSSYFPPQIFSNTCSSSFLSVILNREAVSRPPPSPPLPSSLALLLLYLCV